MATLTRTGEADTSASNPQNWQPAQLPAAGDDLQMPLASTIDIHGDALAGDTLTIGSDGSQFPAPAALLNVSGRAHFSFANHFPPAGVSSTTVDLAQHAKWIGGFVTTFAPVFIHGGTWRNTGSTINGARVDAATDIKGTGFINVGSAQSSPGFLEVEARVGHGQSIRVQGDPERFNSGTLQVDKPDEFKASVALGRGEVVLEGLTADSFSFRDGVLRLFEGDHLVDKLRLSLIEGATGFGVSVVAGGVNIYADGSQPGVPLTATCHA